MKLRSIVLGTAVSIIAVGDASAADLYTPPPEVATPVATYNWTGIYAGVVGGWNHLHKGSTSYSMVRDQRD